MCYLLWMEYNPPDLRQAWLVLRATRLKLASRLPRDSGSATGFIPPVAMEQLNRHGWDTTKAEGAVRLALLKNFMTFADSWDAYIDNRGWLTDLLGAEQSLREKIASRFPVAPLIAIAEAMRLDPQAPLKDLQQWGPLLQATGELARRSETGEHPAVELMVAKYGMHRELAKAVLLHSRVEPWWAHMALAAGWLICAAIFITAIVDPHNPGFDNASVGGVGPLHYIMLPLFILMFLAAQIWLIKTRPRRQQQWREQLTRYVRAREVDTAG
jgi:hypothetical protein